MNERIKEIAIHSCHIFGNGGGYTDEEIRAAVEVFLINRADYEVVFRAWHNGVDYVKGSPNPEEIPNLIKAIQNSDLPFSAVQKIRKEVDLLPKRYLNRVQVTKTDKRNGFVYLAKNYRSGMFKIGWSTRPSYREKTLQSEEPEIKFLCHRAGSMSEESALHKKYRECRVRGEWFRLNDSMVEEIVEFIGGKNG